MNDKYDFAAHRHGAARRRIDWALVARAEAWARRERAETFHQLLVVPVATAARAAVVRIKGWLSAPAGEPCASDAA